MPSGDFLYVYCVLGSLSFLNVCTFCSHQIWLFAVVPQFGDAVYFYFSALIFSLSQQVSIADNFLVLGRTLCLFPLLSAGILSCFNLFKSSICSQSLCVHMYTSLVSGR